MVVMMESVMGRLMVEWLVDVRAAAKVERKVVTLDRISAE